MYSCVIVGHKKKVNLLPIVESPQSLPSCPELVQYRVVHNSKLNLLRKRKSHHVTKLSKSTHLVNHKSKDSTDMRVAADEVCCSIYGVNDPCFG